MPSRQNPRTGLCSAAGMQSENSQELKDEDASRLLRSLCGDMFIEASRLEGFVSRRRPPRIRTCVPPRSHNAPTGETAG